MHGASIPRYATGRPFPSTSTPTTGVRGSMGRGNAARSASTFWRSAIRSPGATRCPTRKPTPAICRANSTPASPTSRWQPTARRSPCRSCGATAISRPSSSSTGSLRITSSATSCRACRPITRSASAPPMSPGTMRENRRSPRQAATAFAASQRHLAGDFLNPVTWLSHGIDVIQGPHRIWPSRLQHAERREEGRSAGVPAA